MERHRVHEGGIHEAWRRDREQSEEEKADSAREKHGVSEEEVAVRARPVEDDRGDEDELANDPGGAPLTQVVHACLPPHRQAEDRLCRPRRHRRKR
jgi:hypothetical protein